MKKLSIIIGILFSVSAFSQEMKVHQTNGIVESFLLSQIDSITFSAVPIIPTEGLVAYYPFNGNANDESGNGNNGTIYNAILSTDRFGNQNKAYLFNGIDSYISIEDKPCFHSLNQITLSAWFNASNVSTAWTKLIGKHYDASSGSFFLIWEHQYIRFSAITSFQYGGFQSENEILSIWHHACGVYDGTHMYLYIDGVLVNSVSNAGSIQETDLPITIGNSESWNEFYNGLIDDIRIYNRALSISEVEQLYQEGGWVK